MTAPSPLRIHAIYAVLDDVPLFRASVASIYDHVDRITVITTHDRDWMGRDREPSTLVTTILGRDLDPERKMDLIVSSETNEARARNRAMDYAAPRRESCRVRRQHADDREHRNPDYFLIIDADEIYGARDFERIIGYIESERRAVYRVPCVRYFKRWNYAVDGHEWAISFVRSDQRLPYLRLRPVGFARRAAAHIPGMPSGARSRLLGYVDVPASVGVFHHGSYVGPRERMEAKLGAWGHADDVTPNWLEEVWDRWTPAARDFNPVYPEMFPGAAEIDPGSLPLEIVDQMWPAEYLDQ